MTTLERFQMYFEANMPVGVDVWFESFPASRGIIICVKDPVGGETLSQMTPERVYHDEEDRVAEVLGKGYAIRFKEMLAQTPSED